MLNNNKRAVEEGRKLRAACRGREREEWKKCSYAECVTMNIGLRRRASRPSDMRATRLHGKFLFYPFLFHLCHSRRCSYTLCCFHCFRLKARRRRRRRNSPSHTKQEPTDWQDTQSSDCLIFRKRSQEILIGILCICFEASAPSRGMSEWGREREKAKLFKY